MLKYKFFTLVQHRPGRYLLIGGSIYLFELAVITVLKLYGSSDVVAVGTSFWTGLLLSFALQKWVTFNDRRTQVKIVGQQLAAFGCLVLFNFIFTLAVARILHAIVPAAISRTIALGITTVWNYYLYRTRLFKAAAGVIT